MIEDIKNKIALKFPSHLLIWPINVQGRLAENDIIEAIKGINLIDKRCGPEVIILARGGGSVEDLMPFNSEKLAYEIYNSKIPIISAVGHETDFTIADFAADYRASTPTAAADMVVPNKKEMENKIKNHTKSLNTYVQKLLFDALNKIHKLNLRLINPYKIIDNNISRLRFNESQVVKIINYKIINKKNQANTLLLRNPTLLLKNLERGYNKIKNSINQLIDKTIEQKDKNLKIKFEILVSNSYQKWLEKGFAIVKNKDNKLIKNLENLSIDEKIKISFLKGEVNAKVKTIKKN